MTINILSEGDEWFVSGKDIIRHIESVEDSGGHKRFKVKKLADKGDQAVEMLSGKGKLKLAKYMKKKKYDVLLFSGGINDLFCKADFALFVKEYKKGEPVQNLINQKKLDRRIRMICRAVEELVDLAIAYHISGKKGKKLKVVTHTYDRSEINEKEEIWCGDYRNTWMYDILSRKKGFPETDFTPQRDIAHYFIAQLQSALLDLEAQLSADHKASASLKEQIFFVADTRNTLGEGDWVQEFLPGNQGLKKLTQKIVARIDQAIGPNQVPTPQNG